MSRNLNILLVLVASMLSGACDGEKTRKPTGPGPRSWNLVSFEPEAKDVPLSLGGVSIGDTKDLLLKEGIIPKGSSPQPAYPDKGRGTYSPQIGAWGPYKSERKDPNARNNLLLFSASSPGNPVWRITEIRFLNVKTDPKNSVRELINNFGAPRAIYRHRHGIYRIVYSNESLDRNGKKPDVSDLCHIKQVCTRSGVPSCSAPGAIFRSRFMTVEITDLSIKSHLSDPSMIESYPVLAAPEPKACAAPSGDYLPH